VKGSKTSRRGEVVLVVAAHPDDEVLGCGGAMARHARQGDIVETLLLAEGATSRDQRRDAKARAKEISALRDCATKAARALGVRPPRFGGLPDNRMDSIDLIDVVKIVEAAVREIRPSVVYTHHASDLNIDHRITHQAVLTGCRPMPGSSVRSIYAFEVPSSTEWAGPDAAFRPNRNVSIADEWRAKKAALEIYQSEMRPFPHARSLEAVEALAVWRGASVGVAKAEAFEVLRQIRL
jgi:LmbE family N-acetylglucosaminyl deacetylase